MRNIDNYTLLKKVMKMTMQDLVCYLESELLNYYDKENIETNGKKNNYIYAVGEEPILLIAHLDTVFEEEYKLFQQTLFQNSIASSKYSNYAYGYGYMEEEEEKVIYHDKEKGVMWSPQGMGADDRVGVFMILSLLRDGHKPSVLFTTDEETLCQSAVDFAENYKDISLPYKYLLELDRQGEDDCVFYNCYNYDFTEYIENYGFKYEMGSRTDISEICPVLKIAGVNLSVGYYNEHTKEEMLDLNIMERNFYRVSKMIKDSNRIKEQFKYTPKKVRKGSLASEFKKAENVKETIKCDFCKKKIKDHMYSKTYGKICQECFETLLF